MLNIITKEIVLSNKNRIIFNLKQFAFRVGKSGFLVYNFLGDITKVHTISVGTFACV